MYDMIKLVLDNCKRDDDYDFTKIDSASRHVLTHPLMLMALSGEAMHNTNLCKTKSIFVFSLTRSRDSFKAWDDRAVA